MSSSHGGGVHAPCFEQNFFSCVSVLSVSSILVFSVSALFPQFYFLFVANPPLFPQGEPQEATGFQFYGYVPSVFDGVLCIERYIERNAQNH